MLKEAIVDHIIKNKFRLFAETSELRRDRDNFLITQPIEFQQLIKDQYQHRLRGHVIRDISINLGIDFETSLIELEEVDLEEVLR